jgi:hypothetical protein
MAKFQEEVKQKMDSMKNKIVKSSDIDHYYSEVQTKMKNLEKVVETAFQELKLRSKPSHDNNSNIAE